MSSFRFHCPNCNRKYKSNKDLHGRLKRCGKCRKTFTIVEADATPKKGAPAAPARARMAADPDLPIEEVFAALHAERLPGSFASEVTFGHFDPAYRVALDVTVEDRGHRTKFKSHRQTAELPPPIAEEALRGARTVAEVDFDRTAAVLEKLASKPGEVRKAAEKLALELRPPEGGRFVARHLVVEHLSTWRASWVFHEQEGTAWFYGKPLRAYLPDPPKRSAWPAAAAVILTLGALAAIGYAAKELGVFDPAAPAVATAPASASKAAAKPRPEPVRFARDGVVQLDDGGFLRGTLERKDESIVVTADGKTEPVSIWKIESIHVDAPVFFKSELRRVDDFESRAKNPPAGREALVALFLELHRLNERWGRLEPLAGPSEIAAEQAPRRRLETLKSEIERALEKAEPPAAALPVSAPAADSGPRPSEPPPAAARAAELLARMGGPLDPAARARLAADLRALAGEKLPHADLILFASLYLSRGELDAGLVVDRLQVKTAQVESTFEGVFEKQGNAFMRLRMPSGAEIVAYRDNAGWIAQLPGGTRLDQVQLVPTPAVPTISGGQLRAALDRLPPARWTTAPGGEHLRAAKAGADALQRKSSADRGRVLVRHLTAAHAAAALRTGTPAEILEARGVLQSLGYAPAPGGRWERADDRRAVQLGQLLRDGQPEEARAQLPRGSQDFFGVYRAMLVLLQAPMQGREDLDRAGAAVDNALAQAYTGAESRHLLAVKGAVTGFGACAQCGGNAAKICMTCRGKGQRTEACLPCNGLGYIATVGIGASGFQTCQSCQGKPIRGTRPCERCDGKGTRSCAKCQGVSRTPAPADLGRTGSCPRCNGSGGHGDLLLMSCPPCAGLGLRLMPAGAPDAVLP